MIDINLDRNLIKLIKEVTSTIISLLNHPGPHQGDIQVLHLVPVKKRNTSWTDGCIFLVQTNIPSCLIADVFCLMSTYSPLAHSPSRTIIPRPSRQWRPVEKRIWVKRTRMDIMQKSVTFFN